MFSPREQGWSRVELDDVRDHEVLPAQAGSSSLASRVARGEARVVPLSDALAENVESTQPALEETVLRSDHDQRLWRAFARLSHQGQELQRRLVINREPHQTVA
ncbi:hypothetical protein [Amycolatopsis sp. cmx-11-32]|uniref:hypothetical protein n=1 Tax=Amycolatopsis sp. cmx-11-32 TaxID=2785796 RepID=UPI0039E61BA8